MRYLLLLMTDAPAHGPAATETASAETLRRYTAELIRAGVLLVGEVLEDDRAPTPGSAGAPDRAGSPWRPTAFWIVQAADRAEALEWARRLPVTRGPGTHGRVEVRRILSGAAVEA